MTDFLLRGEYESGELNIVSHTLSADDIVLEIGTGLGLLSAYCAKKIGDQRVSTVEANPNIRSIIEHTYALNLVSPKLTFAVASTQTQTTRFYTEPNDLWGSSLHKNSTTSVATDIQAIDINELIHKHSPTYLIMDVEGSEKELIPHISWHTIRKLQIELHGKFIGNQEVDKLIEHLDSCGFVFNKCLSSGEQYYFSQSPMALS
jgi:FkbM family methyltransferase